MFWLSYDVCYSQRSLVRLVGSQILMSNVFCGGANMKWRLLMANIRRHQLINIITHHMVTAVSNSTSLLVNDLENGEAMPYLEKCVSNSCQQRTRVKQRTTLLDGSGRWTKRTFVWYWSRAKRVATRNFRRTRAQEYEEVWYKKQIGRDRSIRSNNEVDENNGWDIPAIHNVYSRYSDVNLCYHIHQTVSDNVWWEGSERHQRFVLREKEDSGKTEEDELESEDGMFLITAEGLDEDDESETNNRAVDQQLKQIGDKWTSQAHELGWTDQVN